MSGKLSGPQLTARTLEGEGLVESLVLVPAAEAQILAAGMGSRTGTLNLEPQRQSILSLTQPRGWALACMEPLTLGWPLTVKGNVLGKK